jgi:tetratricopeptide (TPR) repeat protein
MSGCSGPDHPPPPLLREAARENRVGDDAYLRGDSARAIPALVESARLHLAAGDLPGTLTALLNLALARRAAGDLVAARATSARMGDLLAPARQQAATELARNDLTAQTGWVEGLIALDAGDPKAAQAATDRVPLAGRGLSARWEARVESLRGEVALRQERPAEALTHAKNALSASARALDRAEEAHARRLSAAARMAQSQWTDARTDLLASIALEEQLGAGTRMAGDLESLAVVTDKLGDRENAELYRARAQAIKSVR